jgi:hypothetical protein
MPRRAGGEDFDTRGDNFSTARIALLNPAIIAIGCRNPSR